MPENYPKNTTTTYDTRAPFGRPRTDASHPSAYGFQEHCTYQTRGAQSLRALSVSRSVFVACASGRVRWPPATPAARPRFRFASLGAPLSLPPSALAPTPERSSTFPLALGLAPRLMRGRPCPRAPACYRVAVARGVRRGGRARPSGCAPLYPRRPPCALVCLLIGSSRPRLRASSAHLQACALLFGRAVIGVALPLVARPR